MERETVGRWWRRRWRGRLWGDGGGGGREGDCGEAVESETVGRWLRRRQWRGRLWGDGGGGGGEGDCGEMVEKEAVKKFREGGRSRENLKRMKQCRRSWRGCKDNLMTSQRL